MPTLSHLVQDFNDSADYWISFAGICPGEKFYFCPGPGSWSVAQVYAHLICDTSWMVQQMYNALHHPLHTNEKMTPAAAQLFRENSFPDQRIENPNNDPMITPPENQVAAADSLRKILSEINDLFAADAVFSTHGKTAHPGLGYFTAAEWLQYATMHLRHHERQKQRIEAEFHRQNRNSTT